MKSYVLTLNLLLWGTLTVSSCLKKEFDTPPDQTSYDPMLKVTHSISQLMKLNGSYNPVSGGDTTYIAQDIVISGIVTANDRSGNFYKQLVIQDSSAAIMLLVDANNLYNDYPVGRKIYVKCNGLWLGYDGGLPVLGYYPDEQLGLSSIPQQRINDFIVRANIGNPVIPDTVDLTTIKTAQPAFYNKLVYIKDVAFTDTTKPYAQPTAATNREIEDCTGNKLVVRTSNYASFSALPVPGGMGSITGIYTVFISSTKATPQLIIRDTADVQCRKPRCGEITGNILFAQTFSSATSGTIQLSGWTNFSESGSKQWEYGNNGNAPHKPYAQISAFQSGQASVRSWLITPGINLTGVQNPRLIFINADGYDKGASLKVLLSTDYSGSSPLTAIWTQLNAHVSTGHTNSYGPFISSGEISLNDYVNQTVYLAFRYEGADAVNDQRTTTYEIDDVYILTD